MTREFTGGTTYADKLADEVVTPAYLVVLSLPHPTQVNTDVQHALWTRDFDKSFYLNDVGNIDAVGAGDLLSVSDLNETNDLTAAGISVRLVATTDFVTVLRDREYQGYPIKVYLNVASSGAGNTLIFDGFIDQMLFSITENAVVITLKAESKLIRLSKSSNRSYTQEDQIAEYPNDKGFEYMNNLQDREVLWGRK